MKVSIKRSLKLTKEEVTDILFKAVFGSEYNPKTCEADYGYSSWNSLQISIKEEQEIAYQAPLIEAARQREKQLEDELYKQLTAPAVEVPLTETQEVIQTLNPFNIAGKLDSE